MVGRLRSFRLSPGRVLIDLVCQLGTGMTIGCAMAGGYPCQACISHPVCFQEPYGRTLAGIEPRTSTEASETRKLLLRVSYRRFPSIHASSMEWKWITLGSCRVSDM